MMQRFIMSKIISICFLTLAFIFAIIFLALLGIPFGTIATMAAIYVALFIGWLIVSFQSEKHHIQRLHELIQQVEEPYLVGELLPSPTTSLEEKYYEIMKVISHDAISRVEKADHQARDYKDYVERWIHELKTPLTAMNLILATEPNVRKLRRELKRADNLTDTILQYARLQSLEKDKQFTTFPLENIVNVAIKNQMDLLIAAKMQVDVIGEAIVYTDQKVVQFMINQLLINSAKYSPNSKITITVAKNTLTYEDDGIGIPKHELPRIFERGYTGTNGRQHGTSTGMGLYIVASLCKELNISLSVTSELGEYTRFVCTFPNLTKL